MTDILRLTTPGDVKKYLRMTPAQIAAGGASAPAGVTSVDDGLIESLVLAVSESFSGYCSRNFAVTEYTEIRNGTGTNKIVLQNYPVASITSIAITGARATPTADAPSTPLTQGVDFAFDTRGLVQLYSMVFPRGVANVSAVYQAGYRVVPNDLAHAAAKWCAVRYREFERLGQRSKSIGGETVSFDIADCPPDVKMIVDRYQSRSQISGNAIGRSS